MSHSWQVRIIRIWGRIFCFGSLALFCVLVLCWWSSSLTSMSWGSWGWAVCCRKGKRTKNPHFKGYCICRNLYKLGVECFRFKHVLQGGEWLFIRDNYFRIDLCMRREMTKGDYTVWYWYDDLLEMMSPQRHVFLQRFVFVNINWNT